MLLPAKPAFPFVDGSTTAATTTATATATTTATATATATATTTAAARIFRPSAAVSAGIGRWAELAKPEGRYGNRGSPQWRTGPATEAPAIQKYGVRATAVAAAR